MILSQFIDFFFVFYTYFQKSFVKKVDAIEKYSWFLHYAIEEATQNLKGSRFCSKVYKYLCKNQAKQSTNEREWGKWKQNKYTCRHRHRKLSLLECMGGNNVVLPVLLSSPLFFQLFLTLLFFPFSHILSWTNEMR